MPVLICTGGSPCGLAGIRGIYIIAASCGEKLLRMLPSSLKAFLIFKFRNDTAYAESGINRGVLIGADSISSILQIPFFCPLILRNALLKEDLEDDVFKAPGPIERPKDATLSSPRFPIVVFTLPSVSVLIDVLMICFMFTKQLICSIFCNLTACIVAM